MHKHRFRKPNRLGKDPKQKIQNVIVNFSWYGPLNIPVQKLYDLMVKRKKHEKTCCSIIYDFSS